MNVKKEVARLEKMTTPELKREYEEVFGEQCRSNHKTWLLKRIAWRLQANAEGDLSERIRQRALEMANDSDLRIKAPRQAESIPMPAVARRVPTKAPVVPAPRDPRIPMAGSVITRQYKGREVEVAVLDDGFEFEGETYKTLTAAAKAITGSHTNGYLFFRLDGKGGRR